MEKRNLDTICVQGGWQPKNGEPRVLPIYQSTTYKYDNSEQMGRLFDLEEEGYFYTRLQNPTNDIQDRQQIIMQHLIFAKQVTILYVQHMFMEEHLIFLELQ